MSGFTENITDCLVFKLVEIEADTDIIDNTIYITYDNRHGKYLIRGKRNTLKVQSCEYSYECTSARDLADFIQYLICPENLVHEVLYSYETLPEDPDDITFDYLAEYDHPFFEISGYNYQQVKRTSLLKKLRMLRNITN